MESRAALLTVAVPLIAFKIWFAILLLTYAPTRDGVVWIAVTHWPLLIVFGLMIAPGIATYRLVRARAHRKDLQRAEWMVSPPKPRKVPRKTRVVSGVQCSALWETVSRLEGGD
jgi:hypothetical protein